MELEYQSTNKCNHKEELDSVSILLIEHIANTAMNKNN